MVYLTEQVGINHNMTCIWELSVEKLGQDSVCTYWVSVVSPNLQVNAGIVP
jgi:hypothetical protein